MDVGIRYSHESNVTRYQLYLVSLFMKELVIYCQVDKLLSCSRSIFI